ncbi:MAG: helix-turn-helix domain-containing protein [Bacteroidales bacterium]
MADYIEPVLYIGISQSFFAGLLIATRKPVTVANRLMAAWLFMICIEFIFALINSKVLEMYSFQFITFTYGPLLYLYVRFMTDPAKKFNWLSLLHFIPFVAFFVVSVVFRSEPLVRDLRNFFISDRFLSLRLIYGLSFFFSITIYSTLTFIKINRHQKNLKNLVSYTSGVLTLNWLKIISISFYSAYFILFILGGLNMTGNYIPFDPYFVIFFLMAVFAFAYSFYGIKQPAIFHQELVRDFNGKNKPVKYQRSGLKNEKAEEYLQLLLSCMEIEKPYLNNNLNIQDLSVRTGIPRHYITQVLNEKYGKNFFTFINEYRVKEVIKRLSDPKYENYTILAIAYDSGFNSKATFNSFFKNFTGLTPSEYREKIGVNKS